MTGYVVQFVYNSYITQDPHYPRASLSLFLHALIMVGVWSLKQVDDGRLKTLPHLLTTTINIYIYIYFFTRALTLGLGSST